MSYFDENIKRNSFDTRICKYLLGMSKNNPKKYQSYKDKNKEARLLIALSRSR